MKNRFHSINEKKCFILRYRPSVNPVMSYTSLPSLLGMLPKCHLDILNIQFTHFFFNVDD